jgi:hypothetical protein
MIINLKVKQQVNTCNESSVLFYDSHQYKDFERDKCQKIAKEMNNHKANSIYIFHLFQIKIQTSVS